MEERRLADDLYTFARILRRGWRFVAVAVLVCMTLAVFYVLRIKPVYKGTARLLILQQGGRPLSIGSGADPLRGFNDADDYLPTHIMIIRSPLIAKGAIEKSGLKDLSVGTVIGRMSVARPDPGAKILDIGYSSESAEDAVKVIAAIMESYKKFLESNYQKNTNDVITLITKARDELSEDLKELEHKYLEFRKTHRVLAAGDDGRPLDTRKLEVWDTASSSIAVRETHLKVQLEMGRKMVADGMGMWGVANALRLIGEGQAGGGGVPEASSTQDATSFERLSSQLAETELKRQMMERMLDRLREYAQNGKQDVSDDDAATEFYADPAAAGKHQQLALAQDKLNAAQRFSRNGLDPVRVNAQRKVNDLSNDLKELWKKRSPAIYSRLARERNGDVDLAIRKTETDLVTIKAEESVIRERLELMQGKTAGVLADGADPQAAQGAANGDPAAPNVADRDKTRNQAQGNSLLDSIARSLEGIQKLRKEMRDKFEQDLVATKDSEIDRLTEASLKANLDRHRAMFQSVLEQLKQAQLVSDYSSITAQVLNPPSAAPGRPMAAIILLAALLCGCGLGVGCAFVADMFDARIRTLPEIRKALDLAVLGLIPQLSAEDGESAGEIGLISHAQPRSRIAESYKSIRTNLEFHRRNRRIQVIQVTSPHSGDGKSTSASNLAISLAHAGRKVLLIDADLRRPSQHHIYGVRREFGLVHILNDSLPLSRVVQSTSIDNLDLISAGPDASNPAELLASQRFGEFVQALRDIYEVIIIDSPPLLAVTDPCVIGAVVDGIVLVVRATAIKRHEAEQTVELLRSLGTPLRHRDQRHHPGAHAVR